LPGGIEENDENHQSGGIFETENSGIWSRNDLVVPDMNTSSKVRMKVNSPTPTSHFVIISDIKRPNRVKTMSKTAYTPAKNVLRVSKYWTSESGVISRGDCSKVYVLALNMVSRNAGMPFRGSPYTLS
jgi:hypothetical protein